ncbi:DUF452 family protein [Porphyromonas pogonae]|uniref:DUF452 family protein n=1 Tax=Porphyromonas pogonae TaxID=867595 RepID=UPI002E761708|nr:pimeloyl-ACP methyl esterase BioG family protein [Porphyromonas pogonae]
MQYKLYHQEENKQLILFFNGWAMTPETVERLIIPSGYDLLSVWDYREDNLDFDFTPYHSIILCAWSMGVWAADKFCNSLSLPIEKAVAVCGTGYPCDDAYGIPEQIFRGTYDSLSQENRAKFNRRMCGGKSLRTLFEALEKRPTQEIKDELGRVMSDEMGKSHPVPKLLAQGLWTRAFVGLKDRIIPPQNQINYWSGMNVEIVELDGEAHYAFSCFERWEELWN